MTCGYNACVINSQNFISKQAQLKMDELNRRFTEEDKQKIST
jgi:hypothetical protein